MASAELLKMTHIVDDKVMGVDDRVKGVEEKVQDVRSDVHDVGNKVLDVEGRVQVVCSDVQDVGNKVQDVDHKVQSVNNDISIRVQGVNDKLDRVDRSLFLCPLLLIPSTHTFSQGTSSKRVFQAGFRPRIHPPITTLHAKLITTVRLNGFFKEVSSINGNPPVPSCGYTENVSLDPH